MANGAAAAIGIGGSLLEGYVAGKEASRANDFSKSMTEWAKAYLTATPEKGRTGYSVSEKADEIGRAHV